MSKSPQKTEFEASLRRVELGLSTIADAQIIRQYVSSLEDALKHERESSDRLQRSLDEAFNSGSGAYIP